MAKRKQAQRIGTQGENLFQTLHPGCFTSDKFGEDLGQDFICQCLKDENTTQKYFLVQVKTKNKLICRRKHVSVPLKTERIKDYINVKCMPVFLVGIDLKERLGYWIFIQKYIFEDVGTKKWRKQKKLSIQIPLTNNFTDGLRFIEDVKISFEYMKKFNAAPITSVIQAKEMVLQSLDPRFSPSITATRNTTHYMLNVKENVPFKFNLKSDDAAQKFSDMMKSGESRSFKSDEIGVEGSKLLEHLFGQIVGEIRIQANQTSTATMTISVRNQEDNDIAPLESFSVTIKSGQEKSVIHGRLGKSPIEFRGVVTIEKGKPLINITSFYVYDHWVGKPLNTLSYFEQIRKFFLAALEGKHIAFTHSKEGNIQAKGIINISKDDLKSIVRDVNLIDKARKIANKNNLTMELSSNITGHDERDIEMLYELLGNDRVVTPLGNEKLTWKLNRDVVTNLLNFLEKQSGEYISLGFDALEPQKWTLFGEKVDVGPLIATINSIKLMDTNELHKKIEDSDIPSFDVEFIGGPDAVMVYERKPTTTYVTDQQ